MRERREKEEGIETYSSVRATRFLCLTLSRKLGHLHETRIHVRANTPLNRNTVQQYSTTYQIRTYNSQDCLLVRCEEDSSIAHHGVLMIGELPLPRETSEDVAVYRAELPRPRRCGGPGELETFRQVPVVPNLNIHQGRPQVVCNPGALRIVISAQT